MNPVNTPADKQLAPLWRRLFAMVYDSFLLFAIALGYSALHIGIKIMMFGVDAIKTAKAGSAGDPLLFLGVLFCFACFYYWFWTRNGQTLGMQSWRLRVEQANGALITSEQALKRLAIAPLSLLCLGLGYWWCLGSNKRCWHDTFSNTQVIVTPKT